MSKCSCKGHHPACAAMSEDAYLLTQARGNLNIARHAVREALSNADAAGLGGGGLPKLREALRLLSEADDIVLAEIVILDAPD